MLVEVERIDCSLIVDTDECCGTWCCSGKEGRNGFLYGMEFGVIYFGPVAERAASIRQPVELLVPTVVNGPSTANGSILKFGAIGVNNGSVVWECS
jgi:hypothetical protein